MQEINEAVEVLSNEDKRRRYDSGEDIQEMSQQGGGFHHHGFPFGSHFGGGGGFNFNFNFG
jgi:DnaJ-class molecular chaperone